ncbi:MULTISPECIES: hypothetical protein [Ensifer]|uniref:Uncharacterized protein n=1 Tax=Ensifer adhaerens TaxID=106592 RepID=A0ABY8HK39_ENSAD|nr:MULTISPECIES: hypothetical protein [Ensifer]KSV69760.1 hypothetical protein N182_31765 [Sinorhizobium sp. GL2]MBD9537869.1 hypothetical protein [Ensifer sp. ENS04]MBD9570305.1 hypothetical protein [Ensifer sp. ENS08]ANK72069.1 hypothetical protein FA04_05155 [Ensifer adhaerens]KDP74410.1 hypothetical protein FA04_06270 [Ensifer adhaerens]
MANAPTAHRITLGNRPLIVSDIDDVVLEFINPFKAFLGSCGHVLLPRSFRLTGNIITHADEQPVTEPEVKILLDTFYGSQDRWQTPAAKVVETLAALSEEADIVFLTAMPPQHAAVRRALLDRLGLPYPLLASEEPKGPIVQKLHGSRTVPLVFIDDMLRNLRSVKDHAPTCLPINLMADSEFKALAPKLDADIRAVADWPEAAAAIRAHFRG